jgi:nitrogenase molybdenum-iron protein beta chain
MLDLTPKELYERQALRINPAKTCQPIGAMYAALGVHKCMPHSHGSQGCCSYHRTLLTRHFKEPAVAASSSFTEGSSVFGGGSNVRTAIKNILDIYNPDIIAVHTTCLSETIGDDVRAFVLEMEIPEGKYVVNCSTPSYVGSHVTGFSNMVGGFITGLTLKTDTKENKVNIIPGFVNPGDMREMKRLAKAMKVPFTMLPDTSGVLDAPMTGEYEMYPKGGTTIEEIKNMGSAKVTYALGKLTSVEPAKILEKKCGVPTKELPLPIGIDATDEFVMALANFSQIEVPYEIEEERGQLVDVLLDAHPYFHNKSVAIYGDPDTVLGLTKLVLEMGMIPKYVITGTPGEAFTRAAKEMFLAAGVTDCTAKAAADLFELHQWIKNDPVDLMIGGTYGKQIAKAEDIPLIRAGFPVIDRYVHSYMPIVGYKGAMRLVELILNALMDRQDSECLDEDLEIVM